MSLIYGPIAQNGYVVPELERAVDYWTTELGVGPWFEIDTSVFADMRYRGQPTNMRVRIALANSGGLQIELIQPLDDEPSPYRDFLRASGGQGGLQHVSSWPTAEVLMVCSVSARCCFPAGVAAPGLPISMRPTSLVQ